MSIPSTLFDVVGIITAKVKTAFGPCSADKTPSKLLQERIQSSTIDENDPGE
jgi:hypothetical protein